MIRFLITRVVLLLAGLVVATLIIFFALRVLPGDVAQVIAGAQASPESVQAIRKAMGLDHSLISQYFDWIGKLLHGDLGTSLLTHDTVWSVLEEKFRVTLPLTVIALVIGLVIALPLGVISAIKAEKAPGVALSFGAQTVAAIPELWLGLLLILLLGRGQGFAGILPATGFPRQAWADPGDAFLSLLLPSITIGLVEGAILLRFVRSATLEALGQDYVRAAAAKGLTRTRALISHGLPNVGLSVITMAALTIAAVITGAVLVESLFNLPGVGSQLVGDVGNRDLPMVQGEIFFLTALVLVLGFLVDIVHRILDPRQRTGEA